MEDRLEEAEEYRIHIVSKHIDQTDAIKDHIMSKLDKLDRLSHNIIDVVVRLDIQKTEHRCSIALKFGHMKVQAHASTTDMYASIDRAIERIRAKVRKWKDKIQHHHARGVPLKEVDVDVHEASDEDLEEINDMIEEENARQMEKVFAIPSIAKNKRIAIKELTLDEAMMKMELSSDVFLIFRAEDSKKVKVMYRRRDGSYGLISPE